MFISGINAHLTYSSGVEAAATVDDLIRNIPRRVRSLKRRFSPHAPFGLGLHLSPALVAELIEGRRLGDLRQFFIDNGLYVFTLGEAPHGGSGRTSMDAAVSDWRKEDRLAYTLRLADILADLLPEGEEGGISTLPLSTKRSFWNESGGQWDGIAKNLAACIARFARIESESGHLIHLDIEPEPWGLIEDSAEVVLFWQEMLLGDTARVLAAASGLTRGQAARLASRHVRLCYDTAHVAVEFETPFLFLERLEAAGVTIGKLQASSALRVPLPRDKTIRQAIHGQLRAAAASPYLRQVVEKLPDGRVGIRGNLAEVLADVLTTAAVEWRIHLHMPPSRASAALLGTTQADVTAALGELAKRRFTRHVEIETLDWEIWPEGDERDLAGWLERDYHWVLGRLQSGLRSAA